MVIAQPSGGYTWPTLSSAKASELRMHGASLTVRVLPEGSDSIEVEPASEDLSKKLGDLMHPHPITLMERDAGAGFGDIFLSNIEFPIDGIPIAVACDVFVKVGEREIPAGSFTSGIGADQQQVYYGPGMDKMRFAQSNLAPIGKAKTVTVILRPSPDAARRTIDLTKIYGGEIVFEGIEVHRQQSARSGTRPSPADDSGDEDKDSKAKKPGLLDLLFGK
jgi:hypothetical protein